jgi:dethiobiotin synthetase
VTSRAARPPVVVVVAGTGTEVGKTWVAALVARELRSAGVTVGARKPAQSFEPGDARTDAHELADATGEPVTAVVPEHRWYDVPMAPPMAAEVLGRPSFTIADLVEELVWPDPVPSVGLVESAGGVRSPLADDGDTVDLVDGLRPELVVVVADAGLGTINDVRLAVDALSHAARDAEVVVLLNHFDEDVELHRRNLEWLSSREGFDVATTTAALGQRVRARLLGTLGA